MLRDQLGFSVRTPALQHVLFTPTYLYRSQVDNRKLYFGLGLASTIACLLLVVDPSVKKHPVYLNMLKTMTMTGVRSQEGPLISSGDQLFFFVAGWFFSVYPPLPSKPFFQIVKMNTGSPRLFFLVNVIDVVLFSCWFKIEDWALIQCNFFVFNTFQRMCGIRIFSWFMIWCDRICIITL